MICITRFHSRTEKVGVPSRRGEGTFEVNKTIETVQYLAHQERDSLEGPILAGARLEGLLGQVHAWHCGQSLMCVLYCNRPAVAKPGLVESGH